MRRAQEIVASGLEAAKPTIRELCRAQDEVARVAAKPTGEFPVFLDYQDDVYEAVSAAGKDDFLLIADLPGNVQAAAGSLVGSSSGAISVRTTPLLTPEEVDAAAKQSATYRPPGA